MVAAIIAFMHSKDDFPGPINLGNPNEVTMRELAETIIRLTNSKSRIEFRPLPSDDPERRQPDISLARERLGWQPTTQLEDGLRKTIDYFAQRLAQMETVA
jgi:UDP-glucuronate decarboxylase